MTKSSSAVLNVSNLTYRYRADDRAALDGVSLEIDSGGFHALLGPNGAGKTTLFSLVAGLRRLQKGVIAIAGSDIKENNLSALSKMGVVFQQSALDLDLTVEQNLNYFAALNCLEPKRAKVRIEEELSRLELSKKRKERVRVLNGGHRRRVEIARALLHDPQLLLFDEATVGLDVTTRQQIVDYAHYLCDEKQIAVLWATHLVDEVFPGDDVSLLDYGRIVDQGSCHLLLSERGAKNLKQLFSQLVGRRYNEEAVVL
ncbi:MAG: ATP-binding cassette domain-containing protein [Gammaproteobacteria bacterium]|nr:ATP-binding cassette domain-containing protein [Gammaproteobacteria bacterium]